MVNCQLCIAYRKSIHDKRSTILDQQIIQRFLINRFPFPVFEIPEDKSTEMIE